MTEDDIYRGRDLPVSTPGARDTAIGVDESTGQLRRFELGAMPLPASAEDRLHVLEISQGDGVPGVATYADIATLFPTPTEGQQVDVLLDAAPANLGRWGYIGGAWQKSGDRVTELEGAVAALEGISAVSIAAPLNMAPANINRGITISTHAALDADRFSDGVNLFDSSKAVPLSITTGTGGVVAHGSYQVTHLMRVDAGVSYRRTGGGAGEYLQWFDIDGNFISATTDSIATAPAGAYWARSSMRPGASNMFTTEAEWPATFRASRRRLKSSVGVEKTEIDRDSRKTSDRPATHAQLLDEVARRFPNGKQLFDYTRVVSGYCTTNGLIQESVSYSTSHFIRVTGATPYYNSANDRVQWFDGDGFFLSYSAGSALMSPAGAAFARFSVLNGSARLAVFCAGSTTLAPFEEYQEAIPLRALPRALRPAAKNQSLPLLSTQATEDAGATVLSGSLGVDAAVAIPFEPGAATFVTCEAQLADDIHSGYGEKVLLDIGGVQVGIASVVPATGTYGSDWAAKLFLTVLGITYYSSAITEQMLGLRHAFSVRKRTPTSSDLAIRLEVGATHVTLFDGATTLFSWSKATYPTVSALLTAMQADIGADYEVKGYHSDGANTASLVRFSALLCKSQEEFDIASKAGTGVTIYDSYETFVPLWDAARWHRLHVDFEAIDGAGLKPARLYLNGQQVYYNVFAAYVMSQSRPDLHGGMVYINQSAGGAGSYVGAPVRNFSITHDAPIERHRFMVVMNHQFIDGPEQDGVAPGGVSLTMTEGRARRFFTAAKAAGWSFVPMPELVAMLHGNAPPRDRVIAMTTDDSLFGYETVPGVSNVFRQHNVKQCTAIIPKDFDFAANADLLDRVERAGHSLAYHGDDHVAFEYLSYAQFVDQVAEARSIFAAADRDTTVMIYPHGSMTDAQGRWYSNNGVAVGFLASGSGMRFGGVNRMRVPRLLADDETPFATVMSRLNMAL